MVLALFFSNCLVGGIFFSATRGSSRGKSPRRPPFTRTRLVAFCARARFPRIRALSTAVEGPPIASVATPGGSMNVVTTASLNAPGASPQFIQLSPEDIAAAPPMDPSLEALLRSVNLCEQLITAFRVQEMTDRELFIALDTSEESLRDTCKDAFGIDPSKGFAHKRELGKVIKAWNNAKVHSETKLKIDAVARSHGEPVSMLSSDWESLMTTFKSKYGATIHDTLLTSQSYFEGFEERLACGQLRAETLAQIVSVREQEEHESKKNRTCNAT